MIRAQGEGVVMLAYCDIEEKSEHSADSGR